MARAPAWKKGQSGNPKGMVPGTRHRATMIAEKLACGEIEAVIKAVVKAAKEGDMMACKIIVDRIWPLPRGGEIRDDRLARLERALGIEVQELGRVPQVIDVEEVE